MAAKTELTTVEAVRRELNTLPDALKESTLAVTALRMAEILDSKTNSATSRTMAAGRMLDICNRLKELADGAPAETSELADLVTARNNRLKAVK